MLQKRGYSCALFAASGSRPDWWYGDNPVLAVHGYTETVKLAKTPKGKFFTLPKLGDILLATKPNLVVVEQGTNMLTYSDNYIKMQIHGMVEKLHGIPCLWVGAPNLGIDGGDHSQKNQDALWRSIEKYAKENGCYVYDSRFRPVTNSDGTLETDSKGNPISGKPLEFSPSSNKRDLDHPSRKVAAEWAEEVSKVIVHIHNAQGRSSDSGLIH